MGMIKLFSSDSASVTRTTDTTPNPNPWRFKILRTFATEKYELYYLQYEHCPTFEGRKICLVKKGTRIVDRFDPHFTEHNGLVARFFPSEWGWETGVLFAKLLDAEKTQFEDRKMRLDKTLNNELFYCLEEKKND